MSWVWLPGHTYSYIRTSVLGITALPSSAPAGSTSRDPSLHIPGGTQRSGDSSSYRLRFLPQRMAPKLSMQTSGAFHASRLRACAPGVRPTIVSVSGTANTLDRGAPPRMRRGGASGRDGGVYGD